VALVGTHRGRSAVPAEYVPGEASGGLGGTHLGEDGELEQQGRRGRSFAQVSLARRSESRS